MSELREVQRAGAKVIDDMEAASLRGEIRDDLALGFRLFTIAHMMKLAHQPGALKIAREYAHAIGIDSQILDGQVQARIYEQVQLARIESQLGGSGTNDK